MLIFIDEKKKRNGAEEIFWTLIDEALRIVGYTAEELMKLGVRYEEIEKYMMTIGKENLYRAVLRAMKGK